MAWLDSLSRVRSARAVASRAFLTAGLVAGCGMPPTTGFSGDWTVGDLGYSRFQIHDGLCPGLNGGCNLDTVLAAGSTPQLQIDPPDADIADLTVQADAPLTITMQEQDGREIMLDAETPTAGDAVLHLMRGDGTEVDRATLTVADPVGLACGIAPTDGVRWDASGFEPSDTLTLSAPTATTTGTRQLQCRVTDADGRPLLAVGVVAWELVAGTDVIGLHQSALALGGDSALSARVYVTPYQAGEATIAVRMGSETHTFDVTVTD